MYLPISPGFGGSAPPVIQFACTALRGSKKKGIMTCDKDGYYEVILGGLNHFNAHGAFYPLEPAKQLFEASSHLMRRIASGNLRGEYGHPRRQLKDTDQTFALRLRDIWEPNISHHIRKIWLQEGKDNEGRSVVFIMGEVKPTGPQGPALKESFENSSEDLCFSIRSFTSDMLIGPTLYKSLVEVVTFDYVNEPGISSARKWKNPSLESFLDTEGSLTRESLILLARNSPRLQAGLESANFSFQGIIDAMGWGKPQDKPLSSRW